MGIISCCVLALPLTVSDARSIFQGVLSKYEPESGAEADLAMRQGCMGSQSQLWLCRCPWYPGRGVECGQVTTCRGPVP